MRRRLRRLGRVLAEPLVVVHEAFHPAVARSFPARPAPARRSLAVVAVALVVVGAGVVIWIGPWGPGVALLAWLAVGGSRRVFRAVRDRRAGLPPGGPARGWSMITDPLHYRRRWRRLGPVFKTGFAGRPQACIVGLERGATLLADESSIARGEMEYDRLVPGGIARRMEGEQARHYRPLLNGAFRAAIVQANAPVLRDHIGTAVARLAAAGPEGTDPLAVIESTLTAAWMEIFLGLDSSADDAAAVAADLDRIVRYRHRSGPGSEEAVARIEAAVVANAREHSQIWDRPNALSTILAREPTAVDDVTLTRNLILLTETTRQDMGGLLMWATKHLADHPAWQVRVRDDGAETAAAVVSETLRMEQSEYLSRETRAATTVDGSRIPAGWPLRVCVAESHRDPDVFEAPDEYRPDRFIDRRYRRHEYAPFGVNDRICAGEQLARFTGREWVLALCSDHLIVTTADGPRTFGAQRHWAPSPSFRIRLEPVEPVR